MQNNNINNVFGMSWEDLQKSNFTSAQLFNQFKLMSNIHINASGLTITKDAGYSVVTNSSDFLNDVRLNLPEYLANHPDANQRINQYLSNLVNVEKEELAHLFKDIINNNITVDIQGTKILNKLGIIGAIVGLSIVASQASAAELSGDHEGAKNIIKDWAIDASGSLVGELIGGAVAGIVGTALVAGGVISAPVSGALILAGALIGGIYGGDAAKDLYELTKDKDGDGKRDLYNRIINLMYGTAEFKITDPLVANINGGTQYTLEANFTRDEIVQQAKESMAWRYALFALNPFVITDIDYSRHNTNSNLDLYNPDTGKGMTEQYLKAA